MELFLFLLPAIVLLGVFAASLPTGFEILRRGNEADPLRREIEAENAEKEEALRERPRLAINSRPERRSLG